MPLALYRFALCWSARRWYMVSMSGVVSSARSVTIVPSPSRTLCG